MTSALSGVVMTSDWSLPGVILYRTTDGGRTWQQTHATSEGYVYPLGLAIAGAPFLYGGDTLHVIVSVIGGLAIAALIVSALAASWGIIGIVVAKLDSQGNGVPSFGAGGVAYPFPGLDARLSEIAVAPDGQAAWGFTTPAMYRGTADEAGATVAIYGDE